jgi:ABC-type transport system involved in multi-copper enzyme maturation permease subunit
MLRIPHLQLIARHSVRHSLRGGAGLIAILATLLIGLVAANFIIVKGEQDLQRLDRRLDAELATRSGEISAEQANEMKSAMARRILGGAMDSVMDVSHEQTSYLTDDKPAMVSAILVVLMLFAPLFSTLAGFNQTSGDIGSKGLRYLLIRTERANIFLGRLIGTTVMMMVVYAILFAILGLYIAAKVHVHPTGDMLLWLLGGYLRIVIFSVPYIALCAWISSTFDTPFAALVMALLFAYVVPLVALIGNLSSPAFEYVNYAIPWGYKWWLFSEQPAMVAGGIAIMAAFTGGLVWFGNWRFHKRDL